MGLFAIGDLHFGFGIDKTMDKFGGGWINHSQKIIDHWQQVISNEDTILIVGDTSWAMGEADAKVDLDIIYGLNGNKIFLEGNHDYWWKSGKKLERAYEGMIFLKNESISYENKFICGSRGWVCPNDTRFTQQDEKIYKREQIRLKLSLEDAMRKGAEEIILIMHFPPMNDKNEQSAFMDIIKEYPISHMIYGHLHGEENHKRGIQGLVDGVEFSLVASDHIDFCPKFIL